MSGVNVRKAHGRQSVGFGPPNTTTKEELAFHRRSIVTCPTTGASASMVAHPHRSLWESFIQREARVRAAREHFKAHVAIAVERVAWANYWELLEESKRIRARSRGRRGAETNAAPHI